MISEIISRRLHQENKNFIGVITGETGSGKSWSALRISEKVDPSFSVDQVIFTPKEFLAILNSGSLHKGNMLVFDECGISLPAREWQSFTNRAINYVLQSFRHENIGLLFTVPSWSFIDTQARDLCHAYMETLAIDPVRETVLIKYFNLQVSGRFNKQYFKSIRIRDNNRWVRVDKINVHKPSDNLISAYEAKKKQFTAALKHDMESGILSLERAKEEKEARKPIDIDGSVDVVCADPTPLKGTYQSSRNYLDRDLIMDRFGCSQQKADIIKKKAEKRLGWSF